MTEPTCRYCGADCSEGRSWDGGNLYACPRCADARAAGVFVPLAVLHAIDGLLGLAAYRTIDQEWKREAVALIGAIRRLTGVKP